MEIGRRNNDTAKRRFEGYETTISELKGQIDALTNERDLLKAQVENQPSAIDSAREQELTTRINTLLEEKAGLEKALTEEKAKSLAAATPAAVPSDASPEQAALIVSFLNLGKMN